LSHAVDVIPLSKRSLGALTPMSYINVGLVLALTRPSTQQECSTSPSAALLFFCVCFCAALVDLLLAILLVCSNLYTLAHYGTWCLCFQLTYHTPCERMPRTPLTQGPSSTTPKDWVGTIERGLQEMNNSCSKQMEVHFASQAGIIVSK